ncbi:MAG: hypothetical protein KC416_15980, partial [Myxococcales bacterium]|nr:hypothetical protein [Myxococcales bacterium]
MNATRMPSDSIAFAAIVAALVAVTPGCSEEAKKVEGTPCETVADCAMGEACVQNFCVSTEGGVGDGGPVKPVSSQLVSIRLDPENASLVSENGSKPTVDFEIIGVYEDETERNLKGAIFSLDAVVIGDVDGGSGVFSANGTIGGSAKVTATLESADQTLTAEGTVTVTLESTFLDDGVAANAPDKFKAAPVTDVSKDARIVYPLDGSVLPQNVYPANIQWLRSAKDDLF